MRSRLPLAIVLAGFLLWPVAISRAPARADPTPPEALGASAWTSRIDHLVKGKSVSVAVGEAGTFAYEHRAAVLRAPASNEKLLLSMATLQEFPPDTRIQTRAMATGMSQGVVKGDLWILGGGDPEVTTHRIAILARSLDRAGVTKVQGSVRGSTTFFSHDWWAPGWHKDFPAVEVALPTALAFNFNTANGVHIKDPERRAAVALTKALRARGIRVTGKPRAGRAPSGLTELARVDSAPLIDILHRQNVASLNFYAETLGKLLGATVYGRPGTIAKGAKAIDAFAAANGAPEVRAYDSSGLSYDDRVSTDDVVTLLWYADGQTWGDDLRSSLPAGGQGTLAGRLTSLTVHAKTGTLTRISALSGWVKSETSGKWIEFSILSKGMSKTTAIHIEDRIVTIVANSAG